MQTNSLPTGDRSIYHKVFKLSVLPTASTITDRLRVLPTSSVKGGVLHHPHPARYAPGSDRHIRSYLERKVAKKGTAKIIVSDVKDFAQVYRFSKRQMSICCNYGFWNAHGCRRHD